MTAPLSSPISAADADAEPMAPVAVVDIGSNSVRLVIYEGSRRSPLPLINEKLICELGRSVARTGRLDPDAVAQTIALLRRFRLLARTMDVATLHVVATAAVREAVNGAEFIDEAARALGHRVTVLSGPEEAWYSAAGVLSGIPDADGLVGDLGGGSLELVDVAGGRAGPGATAPIGTLRLLDTFSSVRKAVDAVDEALAGLALARQGEARDIYAVGGTWRALARIHMERTGYPLHIIDRYTVSAQNALDTARLIRGLSPASLKSVPNVSAARLATIPFGALVLERLIVAAKPRRVVFSAHGLRDGLLFAGLPQEIAREDPLFAAASDLAHRRARSLEHCRELCDWSDALFRTPGPDETAAERRLRHAACLLADIAWRAHPDYRAVRSVDMIAHGNLPGADHAGRAFIALAVHARHVQRLRGPFVEGLAGLLDERALERTRIIGASLRLAYALAPASPGIMPRCPLVHSDGELVLRLKPELADLGGPTVERRLTALAALLGRPGRIEVTEQGERKRSP